MEQLFVIKFKDQLRTVMEKYKPEKHGDKQFENPESVPSESSPEKPSAPIVT